MSTDHMKEKSVLLALAAIGGVTALGITYLLMGHNSVGFAATISMITGIGGYMLPSPLQK